MKIKRKKYSYEEDFIRIRDFLVDSYSLTKYPFNWTFERWEYARHFVAPMIGGPGGIKYWEQNIGIWENEDNEIICTVCTEYPVPGEAFIQMNPGYLYVNEEVIYYAEENLSKEENGKKELRIKMNDDNHQLKALIGKMGYAATGWYEYQTEYKIKNLPAGNLPSGFRIISMEEENDIEARRKVLGLAFNHPEPPGWPSAFSYRELQKAPGYKKYLDIVITAPNHEYAACCIIWYDGKNQVGIIEPLGTHPGYRRRGLAREIILEGARRIANKGAKKIYGGPGLYFYQSVGFAVTHKYVEWAKTIA